MNREDFKEIPNFPGYWVDRVGEVRSQRWAGRILPGRWHKRKPGTTRQGRLQLDLYSATGRSYIRVHQLVLLTWEGPCPEGMECCHNNDDPLDNRLENLRYDTRAANGRDKVRNGKQSYGSRHGRAKLTETDIPLIRELGKLGITQVVIGRAFGVGQAAISAIIQGTKWTHVKEEGQTK